MSQLWQKRTLYHRLLGKRGGKEGQAPKWFKPRDIDVAKQAKQFNSIFIAKTVLTSISISNWLADTAALTHIV